MSDDRHAAGACVSNCTVRDRHLSDCPCSGEHDREHEGHCRGCQPRAAEFGRLCAWDWQRLQSDVATAPALIRHLRAMAEADAGGDKTSNIHSGGDPAWGSILSAAVDAADEVHAQLASWAHLVLEEHPNGPQMRGPDETGARRTHTVAVLDGEIARQYGPYLRKSTIAGTHNPEATSRLVAWLLPMLPWCSAQEWAGEMRREVSEAVRTALARWPMSDTGTRNIPATACPRCDLVSLTYTPPTWERQPFVVRCTNPECGRVFSEDEWTRLCALLGLAERRMVG
jgi:hypothetical protein